jgi:hypothetical protein
MWSTSFLVLFVFCFFESGLSINWQPAYKGKWAHDCDFPGNDIRVIYNVAGEQATSLCDNFAGCTHFTWNKGTLFMKGNTGRTAVPVSGGGPVTCGYLGK